MAWLQRSLGNAVARQLTGRVGDPACADHPAGAATVQRADAVRYTARTSSAAQLYTSATGAETVRENYVQQQPPSLFIDRGTDVELIDTAGERVKVRGIASVAEPLAEARRVPDARVGWIDKGATNLAASANAPTENDRVAQDLDDMLDEHILPALAQWEIGIRAQGNAYLTAYESFQGTLEKATREAKARADFYALALTVVSSGALGWLGEVASSSGRIAAMLSSPTRGAIEDALQTAVGEVVDLEQGGWFTAAVNKETHPLRYLNGQLASLAGLRRDLLSGVGRTKAEIRRASGAVDRAKVLVEMYEYWNDTLASHPPLSDDSDVQSMADGFEMVFWQQYIRIDLTRDFPQLYGHPRGIGGRTFHHPEDAVQERLDDLGISSAAGIGEWDSWYEPTDTAGPRDKREGGRTVRMIGSPWTQKLYEWAVSYRPDRTFD